MNVQTKKEIRSLGPYWIAAFLLPMAPLPWVDGFHHSMAIWSLLGYAVGCALLACASFSMEWSHQTLDLMLVQPVSRQLLWHQKIRILRLALLTLLPMGLYAFINSAGQLNDLEGGVFVWFWLLFPLIWALGMGPYASLLMGNGVAAVVVTLFIPLVWYGGVSLLLPSGVELGAAAPNYYFALFGLPLLLMAFVIYRAAKKRFLCLQTAGFVSTTIRLPEWVPWIGHSHATAETQQRLSGGAWRKLLAKEFRLHEVSDIIAGFMIAASLLLLAYQPIYTHTVPEPRDVDIIPNLIALVTGICGLIIPFTVGAVSVAEERQMGVLDWHLTLPPSHRKQWFLKIVVAYAHCIVLGILLPIFIVMVSRALLMPALFSAEIANANSSRFFIMIGTAGGGSLLITTLAMFASSLARTSMRAIVLAMITVILTGFLCAASNLYNLNEELLSRLFLLSANLGIDHLWFAIICLAALLVVILGLHYLNYRRLSPPLGTASQVAIASLVAALIIGIPFFVVFGSQVKSQCKDMGLSAKACLAVKNNEKPELVLKEINASLDRSDDQATHAIRVLFSNNYRELPEALPIMHRALTNADHNVRSYGIYLLTERLNDKTANSIEYRQAIAELAKAWKGTSSGAIAAVVSTMARSGLDVKEPIAELTAQMRDARSTLDHRRRIMDTLGNLRSTAAPAIPAIIQAVETVTNQSDKLRLYRAATNALDKIDPSAINQLKPVTGPAEPNIPQIQRRYGLPPSQEP